ncbi:MAG: adenylate/guanylate cyclase domain-containing protein, partial [Pseudomonadota bacterium]
IQQDFLSRPDWSVALERTAMVIAGLIVLFFVGNTMPLLGFMALVAAVVAIGGGSWYAFSEANLLLSPVAPLAGVVLPHFVVSGYKYFTSEANRREVTRQFEHFVAPEVIQDILDDPEQHLTPGGALRDLSIMFLDVRRFSTITEKMSPQEVIEFINDLLTPLTDVILENEGTIDKYMGDAVMAFWNAPRETPDHEMKSVRAILAFDEVMERMNKIFQERGLPLIEIGSGINTGECSVGNMGSRKRLAYSCLGDAVNLAARLEGQTKAYGVKNLIGSKTAAGLRGFAAIEIDNVAVKGRTQPETIFTVAGDETVAADPQYDLVAGAIAGARAAYLEQLWDAAEAAFAGIREMPKIGAFDPAPFADAFLARVAEYRENPPPPDWDGVYVATTK